MFRTVSAEWEEQHYPLDPLEEEYNTPEEDRIPTVALTQCVYDKKSKVLTLSAKFIGMPRQFFVTSHHTGKEVRFTAIGPKDKLFSPDQWDGVQQIYRPVGVVSGVDYLVIHQW